MGQKESRIVAKADCRSFKGKVHEKVVSLMLFLLWYSGSKGYVSIVYILATNSNQEILKFLTKKGLDIYHYIYEASESISMAEKLGCNTRKLETSLCSL